jgi:hypothetical protein
VNAARRPRTLELEVSFDAEPIQGRLYDPKAHGGLDRPFSGWLGLISAIEAVRGAEASPPSERKGETR